MKEILPARDQTVGQERDHEAENLSRKLVSSRESQSACMPPPSSPVLSSQPPPPPKPGRRSAVEPEYIERLEGLQAAQAQAAQLRALHAAVFGKARSPLQAKINPAEPDHSCLSPSATVCTIRSGRDYPVFMPSYDHFVLGATTKVENRRSSIDSREASEELARSSRIEEDYMRSSSRLGSEILSSLFGQEDNQLEECPPDVNLSSEAGAVGGNSPKFESLNSLIVPRATSSSAASGDGLVHMGSFSMESHPHHISSVHPMKGCAVEHAKSRIQVAELSLLDSPGLKIKPLSELLTEANRQRRLKEVIEASHGKSYMVDLAVAESGLSCDSCMPVTVNNKMTVVPITDSRDFNDVRVTKDRDFPESTAKDRSAGNNLFRAWFSRVKKKNSSLQAVTPRVGKERAAHLNGEAEPRSVDSMELKLWHANRKRDAAVVEVLELRSAMEEMGKKLDHVEQYCKGLKDAVERGIRRENGELEFSGTVDTTEQKRDSVEEVMERPRSLPGGSVQPTKSEFLHAVAEARVGVKQFCRALVQQLQEESNMSGAWEKLDAELQSCAGGRLRTAPGRVSRTVRYHIESLVNKAFYENFENVSFEKNGTHGILDPELRAQASYEAYLTQGKLGWEDLISKQSADYSASFDRFCAEKMEAVMGRWREGRKGLPKAVAEAFCVAARWVWLLHELALGFCEPAPAAIFRVGSEAAFDGRFMEALPSGHRHEHDAMHVTRLMVMPGFFVINDVVKCKVLCCCGHP